ncbi:MAG: energy transducer TonB [Chloracidobacterium sp.]|nr:energy transducer TonB [Chloracidobacterium sp.]
MNEFTIAVLLLALSASPQNSTLEEKAVNRVQQTPASQYDPTLPSRPFGNWLNQVVGPQTGVSWGLGECAEQTETASEWEQGIPACVEATAILPDDRKIVAQIRVGSFKQGLSLTTRFHFAIIENASQIQSVRRLSDLPQLVREPFSAKRADVGTNPKISALPQIKYGAPQFYYAISPAFFGPPMITLDNIENEPPPPPRPAKDLKVTKGITAGNALTKVSPSYPPMARQMKASGEVQVEITIDEKGRVIEAKAISGHPMLRAAAEQAAMKWTFKPMRQDGMSMKQRDVLTFNFSRPQ